MEPMPNSLKMRFLLPALAAVPGLFLFWWLCAYHPAIPYAEHETRLPPGLIIQSNNVSHRLRWVGSDGRTSVFEYNTRQEVIDAAWGVIRIQEDRDRERWITVP